jgi:hypothetical protein
MTGVVSRLKSMAAVVQAVAMLLLLVANPAVVCGQVAGLVLRGFQPGSATVDDALPDAFGSPFADHDGWWSAVRPVLEPEVRARYTNDEPFTRRMTGGDLLAHDRRLVWDLTGTVPRTGGRLHGAVGWEDQDLRTEINGSKSGAQLRGTGKIARAALRYEWRKPGLTFQISHPVWHDGPVAGLETGAGLRFEPAAWLGLQVVRTRSLNDQRLAVRILEEPMPMVTNLAEDAWQADARLKPRPWLSLEGSWRQGQNEPRTPVTDAFEYQFMPGGKTEVRGATIRLGLRDAHEVVLRYRDIAFDLDAGLHWGGQQFGWLTYGDGFERSRLLSWRWRTARATQVQVEWETLDFEGKLRASIESWPFTETVVDLLGVRQTGQGALVVDGNRVTGSVEFGLARARFRVGSSWIRLHPQGAMATWRSAFLAFGRADYRFDEMRVERADLVSLLVEARLPAGRWELELSLQQFLYGHVVEWSAEGETSAPSAPAGPDQTLPPDSGWPGGTYLRAGIVRRLG